MDGPITLARVFKSATHASIFQPASVYAPRKWLYGESNPGQDKLRMLAEGLECSTEWLRFGGLASSDMHREIVAIVLAMTAISN